jgi:thiol-disulfide isomerase/thioredoxin
MRPWFTLAAAAVAVGLGLWAWQANDVDQRPALPEPEAPAPVAQLERLPELSYPDLEGKARSTREWQDKLLVLNFWATWCPPCREETPLFVELQEQYADRGVQFVGLAIDDKAAVMDFVDSYGVEYPMLLGDINAMAVSKQLGNRFQGLPFTVIVAPGGQIVARHFGGLKREQIEPALKKHANPSP